MVGHVLRSADVGKVNERGAITVDMRGWQEWLSFDVTGAYESLWRACKSSHSDSDSSSAMNN
jgi:hypothetical protein